MPILDHFGLIAPVYDRIIPPGLSDRVAEIAGLPVSGALLDAGGGTGRVAGTLTGLAGQVVIADISARMLAQAARKVGLQPTLAYIEQLPFPAASFERVIMVDALHHVNSQAATARELWRVLKPGGRIVIEELDLRRFPVKLVALGEKLALMRSHFLSPPRIEALFTDPQAQVRTVVEGLNSWVVVDKLPG